MKSISKFALMLSLYSCFRLKLKQVKTLRPKFILAGRAWRSERRGQCGYRWMELPKISAYGTRRITMCSLILPRRAMGLVHTASRTGSGAVDVATFCCRPFQRQARFYLDDFSKESDYYALRMGRWLAWGTDLIKMLFKLSELVHSFPSLLYRSIHSDYWRQE